MLNLLTPPSKYACVLAVERLAYDLLQLLLWNVQLAYAVSGCGETMRGEKITSVPRLMEMNEECVKDL